jgi:hypothetical protein
MARSDQERKEKMTTVYLDRRADDQQAAEEIAAAEEEEAKRKAGANLIAGVAGFLVKPAILMLLWNAVIPGMFGLATLSYWSAMAIYVISRILFGNNKND